ncbi:hypothetical protein CHS0354_031584 [Potamilus streckersoni]|uniref:NACHT domain-containing protein n=1 Tax=Potamilus streckersoni TaxID=2493646 RepID=A0AAE0VUT0_9BIVA|nr:hypothetical protein CHS0354_031584 [Potamilus streckersoni]
MALVQQGNTLEERLKDPGYKNWLKAGMCLIHVKEGLETFVDAESKVLHKDILTKCTPCGQCTQDGVKHKNRQKLCPSCDSFKDEIKKRHKYSSPNWDNTDVQKWTNDHWSVSKCIMNPGQSGNHSASDTDISGLLNFIINYKKFQDTKYGDIQNNAVKLCVCHVNLLTTYQQEFRKVTSFIWVGRIKITQPLGLYGIMVREIRNHLIHSGDVQLLEADLKSYTGEMLTLLMDEKPDGQLKGNQEAMRACLQIQEVVKTKFLIHLKDEYKVRLIALEGRIDFIESEMQAINGKLKKSEQDFDEFKKGTNIQGQEIKKTTEEVRGLKETYEQFQSVLDKLQEDRNAVQTLKVGLQFQETWIRNLEEMLENKFSSIYDSMQIKEKLDELQNQLSEVKSRVEQHDSQIRDHDSQIQDLHNWVSGQRNTESEKEMDNMREDLKSWYKSRSTVPISPLEENECAPLEELFTDVIIERQMDEKNSRNKKKEKLSSYKQIFLDKNNQRIILTGLSGSGKSTFCRKLVCAWCTEEPNKHIDTTRMSDSSNSDSQKATPDKMAEMTDSSIPGSQIAIADQKTDLNVPCISGIIKDLNNVKTDSSVSESSVAVTDQDILVSFTLLFYVYSPKISNEKTLIEVLYNHCLKRESDQLSTFLQEHPEKILIILDGMDEMEDSIPPFLSDLLERKLHPRIVVLMAMRPWRISKLKLKPVSHYDLLLEIQGFSKDNAFKYVEKVIDLNKKHMTMERLSPSPEEMEMMTSFRDVPLLLLFLAHVWCEDQCLPKRRQDLYKKILDCLIKRCLNKTGDKYIIAVTDQDDINMKKDKFWGLYIDGICKAAFHFLLQGVSGPTVIMREESLMIKLGNNAQLKLCALLDCGILSKLDAFSPLEKNVSVTFLHLSIQEYLTSMHLVYNEDAFRNFLVSLNTLNDVLRYENLFIFICGLDAEKGHTAFKRICEVCDDDINVSTYRQGRDVDQYMQIRSSVWNLNEMYKTCLNEMDSQDRVEIPDVTMHDKGELFKCLISRLRSFSLKSLHLEYITLLHHHLVEMTSLTNLTSLKLSTVEISDECSRLLCSCISGFARLKWLELRCFALHDGVLELRSLTNLTDLKLLYLTLSEKCSISLCSSINGFIHLESLVLICMTLHGVIDLKNLTKLASLTLWDLSMSEECSRSLCSSISGCTQLENLELKDIILYDGVLEFRNLTNLTSLRLLDLKMSEDCSRSLCGSIRGCTHLEELVLISINLYDAVLVLSSLTDLTLLTMSMVTMSVDCSKLQLVSISSCTHLKSLELNQIMLHDGILELRSLTNLTSFTLEHVIMSEECSTSLCNSVNGCSRLESLKLLNITLHDGVLEARNLINVTSIILTNVTMSKECCRFLCRSISGFIHLKTLELNLITLHDGILDLRNLNDLTSLTLSGVTMSQECSRCLCSSIGDHNQLSHMQIKDITLHNGVLELRTLNKLTFLTLCNVVMSEDCCRSLCSSISVCDRLDSLELKNIALHDGVLELKSLTNLTSFTLDGVTISKECSRSLCSSVSGCIYLQRLYLMNISLLDGVLDLRSLNNLTVLVLWKVTMSMECSRALCSSLSGCTDLQLRELNLMTLHNDVLAMRNLTAMPSHVLSGVTMFGESSRGLCWNINGCTHLDNLQLENIHDCVLELKGFIDLTSLTLENVTMSEECSRSVCSSIISCIQLTDLELTDIDLHNGILELWSLTNLTSLRLGYVTMSEECTRSVCSSIISCIQLTNLELTDINLHNGILELWSLTNLTSLRLRYVTMSEECIRSVCSSIISCIQLTDLELKNMDFHDGILELWSLTNLTSLRLGYVTMSEECSRSVCSSIISCIQLTNLELTDINLHNGILELWSLTNLTSLRLRYVTMSEECIRSVCSSIISCIQLTDLELKNMNFHDGILELRSLTNLTFLTVENVTISEDCSRSLCSSISGFTDMKSLKLKYIKLHDGVFELRRLTNLSFLKVGSVTMSEECSRSLCSSISRCTRLKSLYLKDITLLDGILEMRSLTNLTSLTLVCVTISEECSRSLCSSISRCTRLKSLYLKDITLFDGILEMRSLTNLTSLTLVCVTMSEECIRSLCSSICSCIQLERLELWDTTLCDVVLELRSRTNLIFALGSVTLSEECSRSLCGSINGCTRLKSLDLKNITLLDGVLDLRSLINLTYLTLENVAMPEECCRSFCGSICWRFHLEKLDLKNMTLHDGVLELWGLNSLTCLTLGNVNMSEESSRSLCNSINCCIHLMSLELTDIKLHNGVLELRGLNSLTCLTLGNVNMSEESSRSLCNSINCCIHLMSLELTDIKLHNGVLELRGLNSLIYLTLGNVNMSEESSRSLCNSINCCIHLTSLELTDIKLHDGILELKSLTSLKFLTLGSVVMSEECIRSLCSSINVCTFLENLELKETSLHDCVFDLRSLTNLTFLKLEQVTMSEECSLSLCRSINSCTHIKSLELKQITFYGGVFDLRSLTNLTSLKLLQVTMSKESIRDFCCSISGCSHLEKLELNLMMLHDGVLDFRSLTNLTLFTLGSVTMSEEYSIFLCSAVSSCTYIESLELKQITLHCGVLDLRSLTNLTNLKLREITMSEECSLSLCHSINSCTHIESLELKQITFYGGVFDLRSLTNLTCLKLWQVTMSEESIRDFCSSISGCTHLEELELKLMMLHDGVLDLRSLTNLTLFTLGSVTMTEECSISLCSTVSSCTYIESLELKQITLHGGVLELRGLNSLTYLTLSSVNMSKESSRSLCNSINCCIHLMSLELTDIKLHDGILELKSLTSLKFLTLGSVVMSVECIRSLYSSINGCTFLENLELKETSLHDCVFDLRSLTNLTFLKLGEVTMSEECSLSLCCSINSCTHIESLELKQITFYGGVFDLRSLTNLTCLTLWQVTMSEESIRDFCSSISGCTHLEKLELNLMMLHDGVLDLKSLTNLTLFTLESVTMSEECSISLCSTVSSCTYIESLELKQITLHGGVFDLRSLTNLTILKLGEVTMSEECSLSLCRSINSCTHIKSLELKQITLHGGVFDLRSLTNLTCLKLWQVTMSEECSRSLCSSISGCTYLEELELHHITLRDNVLDLRSLSHLRTLQFLYVTMSPLCRQTLLASLKNCKRLKLCEIPDSDFTNVEN